MSEKVIRVFRIVISLMMFFLSFVMASMCRYCSYFLADAGFVLIAVITAVIGLGMMLIGDIDRQKFRMGTLAAALLLSASVSIGSFLVRHFLLSGNELSAVITAALSCVVFFISAFVLAERQREDDL